MLELLGEMLMDAATSGSWRVLKALTLPAILIMRGSSFHA